MSATRAGDKGRWVIAPCCRLTTISNENRSEHLHRWRHALNLTICLSFPVFCHWPWNRISLVNCGAIYGFSCCTSRVQIPPKVLTQARQGHCAFLWKNSISEFCRKRPVGRKITNILQSSRRGRLIHIFVWVSRQIFDLYDSQLDELVLDSLCWLRWFN